MTRIVAGRYGGRRLRTPDGRDTRPTSDRVREALFSALESMTDLGGARVLDLFAGSGAVGLEALSRGAAHALLVESDARAIRVIRENIATLGAAGAAVAAGRVGTVLAAGPQGGPYDVVFADPPYPLTEPELTAALAALVGHGWLADGAVLVVERATRSPEPSWVEGVTADRGRRYGESTLWYGRAVAQSGGASEPEG
ncbi:16S rRNA (guanine(966)-N(2))-methyltransferase RsmD [Catellatospora sp. TT07R-123]|uniref:16S rRNA (guanine(966)-N(2))-methyltransferase RsmD n=1 Tax=Catellatospora sp. TT07R-123 TaxID=2733863 RepID=UPI001BB438AE|nr:16S rRNA (guanine(966)-N(2))-methyltransferase RsmD [Catellatospora sp. TT07R-123]